MRKRSWKRLLLVGVLGITLGGCTCLQQEAKVENPPPTKPPVVERTPTPPPPPVVAPIPPKKDRN